MKGILKKIKADVVLSAVLCIILGFILLLFTEQATSLFCKALAIILIIMGAGHIVTWFMNQMGSNLRLIAGIIILLLGVWIFVNPRIIINLIPAIIGAILVLHGIADLRYAMDTKRGSDAAWIPCIVLAVISLVVGILLIVKAFEAAQIAFKLIGIALIYDGISDLFIISRAMKAAKAFEQEMNAIDTEGKEL